VLEENLSFYKNINQAIFIQQMVRANIYNLNIGYHSSIHRMKATQTLEVKL